jgi:gamma-glutamyltranspeptidase/glutathione hydrolase
MAGLNCTVNWKLTMDEILSPTIAYAEEGFPVSELVAYYLGSVSRYMKQFPNVKETYTSDGKIPGKGDLFRNPF